MGTNVTTLPAAPPESGQGDWPAGVPGPQHRYRWPQSCRRYRKLAPHHAGRLEPAWPVYLDRQKDAGRMEDRARPYVGGRIVCATRRSTGARYCGIQPKNKLIFPGAADIEQTAPDCRSGQLTHYPNRRAMITF